MASINMPQRKADPLDTIVKGLQIAQSGFGIYTDWKKLQKSSEMEEESKAGVIDKATAANIIGSGRFDQVKEGTPGALGFKVKTETGTEPLWIAERRPSEGAEAASRYHTVTTGEGVFAVNERDPSDIRRLGSRPLPPRLGGMPTSRGTETAGTPAIKGAEEKKRFDGIVMGYKAVDDMAKALESGENTFSLIGDNRFTIAARNWSEAIGRLQSGGAINIEEEKRFRAMAPKWTDSAEIQAAKLNEMKSEMIRRGLTMGVDEPTITNLIKSAQPSTVVGTKPSADTGRATAAPARQMQPEDLQAMEWARNNPRDPRSAEIMRRLGGR